SGDRFAKPIIICNQDHRFLAAEQLAQLAMVAEAIIVEPVARNTAAAIAAAAAYLRVRDGQALMPVLHYVLVVRDQAACGRAAAVAALAAASGRLVTFGITPTAPDTGYGYICSAAAIADINGAFEIARFVEKPDSATAARYLAE